MTDSAYTVNHSSDLLPSWGATANKQNKRPAWLVTLTLNYHGAYPCNAFRTAPFAARWLGQRTN